MDLTTAVITALGLAAAAGLNAYVPLLVVGVLDRLGVIDLPSSYDGSSSTPVLVVLAVLLAVEFFADKVPGVDSVNDVIQTVVRPAAGALLAAGALGVGTDLPPWVGIVAGLLAAGGVHAGKAAVRPVVNVTTGGVGAPVVSAVEDGTSLVASLLAILAPLLLVVVVVVGVVAARSWWRRRREARRLERGAPA
ncbi:MAG: DUF4126 domain-containing protein [Candidatus Nanopelagicales bacterium]